MSEIDRIRREPAQEAAADFVRMQEWFGPPPVLSSESQKAYNDLTIQLLLRLNPLRPDFVQLMYIRQIADGTWEMIRYTRHKNLAIDRKFRARLEFQAKRERERARLKEAKARELGEKKCEPATQLDRLIELEDTVDCSVGDVDAILQKSADEHDHARALEGTIDYYERVDKLLASATARRDRAVEQLEQYSEGWGGTLRTDQLFKELHDGRIEPLDDVGLALQAQLRESSDGAAK
jgi:hypothetical protein